MSSGPCPGCLGSRRCWVCLGTGYAHPESRRGSCARCAGSRRCGLCTPTDAAMAAAPAGPRTVLVGEDEPDVLDLVAFWFEDDERCAAVARATDGDQALLYLAEHSPDAIVCDFQLGPTTSDQYLPGFRSACPGARIVIHTGSPDLAHHAGIVERGADVVLEKGRVSLQDLVDTALTATESWA